MSQLPDIRVQRSPVYQCRRLSRWLKEWEADQILRMGVVSALAQSQGVALDIASSGRPVVRQVRLLHPVPSVDPARRPIYVAILAESARGAFLIAPFGRFAEPAVPGEWQTRLTAMSLRVLCVWNARAVEARLLERSWPAAVLKTETVRRALELHQHLRDGEPLKSIAEQEVGPPLRHPLDPRHTYLEEESALLEEHLTVMDSTASGGTDSFLYEQKPSPLLMAAEQRDQYTTGTRKRKGRGRKKNHGLHG